SKGLTIAACPVTYAALSDGRLKGWSDAYEVAKAPAEKKQLLISMRMRGATRDEVQKAAKAEPIAPEQTEKPPRLRRIPIPVSKLNATVTISADVATLDGALAILAEATEAVRVSIRQSHSIPTAVRAWADKAKKAKTLPDKTGEGRDG
ncbi:MAG TPA: hypothetical protein VD866_17605, partial [Urbifossiella sp.]|nr:hypothetical protein [Urbifossiella sp.]